MSGRKFCEEKKCKYFYVVKYKGICKKTGFMPGHMKVCPVFKEKMRTE